MGTTLETEWKIKMGISLPIVGYVTVSSHSNEKQKGKLDKKRVEEIEMVVNKISTAGLRGWGAGKLHALIEEIPGEQYNYKIHRKCFNNKIFIEHDLKKRPQMKKMINFIMSDPIAGIICVLDKEELLDAVYGQYNITQCRTIKLLLQVPIFECGEHAEIGKLIKQLEKNENDKQFMEGLASKIVDSALYLRDAHRRRLAASEFKKRLCDMDKADLRDPTAYRAMSEAYEAGILCPKCEEKWVSHQNVINPHARPIPPHKTP